MYSTQRTTESNRGGRSGSVSVSARSESLEFSIAVLDVEGFDPPFEAVS